MKIVNATRDTVLMTHGKLADNFFTRLVGLLGRKNLAVGEGLIITRNNSVHCFFMRFPIDVVFVSKEQRVVHFYNSMRPWHVSKIVGKADYTVELEAGALARSQTQVGDLLQWQDEA